MSEQGFRREEVGLGNRQPVIWEVRHPRELIARLKRGESAPDIVRTTIGGITLDVSKGATMLPSEETHRHAKTLSRAVSQIIAEPDCKTPINIADVGTGSGIIAITVAKDLQKEIQDEKVVMVATDVSEKALKDARANAAANNVAGISFVQGNGLTPFANLDVIISNPPFMKSSILETDNAVATSFIPAQAVVAGATGMDFYQQFFKDASKALSSRGVIVVQHQDFDRDNITRIIHESLGSSVSIDELHGRRQTALVVGNPVWSSIIQNSQKV